MFMMGAATTLAGCATTGTQQVLQAPRAVSKDKLNIAAVGVGGQGHYDIQQFAGENIVALCDVDWVYGAKSFEKFPKAKQYKDYRVMLEKEKSIDAVVVATPDHLHAPISMMALKMGKNVYCEKPLTYSVEEAYRMGVTACEAGVVTQMGNSGQASERDRRLYEYLWSGAIGKVREVHVWTDRPVNYWPQGVPRPEDVHQVPDTLDWDLWLGPAPHRPYNKAYHPFVWRGWQDFGTGALGDMACHMLHSVVKALKLGFPSSIDAVSTPNNGESYPLGSVITYTFPARSRKFPAVKLVWYDGGLKPPMPIDTDRPLGISGTLFVGDKGDMLDGRLLPESRMKEFRPPEKILPRSPGHFEEFILACKGQGPVPGSSFDFASHLSQIVLLGNVALRMGRRLDWDGVARKFTNVPDANQYLTRDYREGWTL
jgi:hypothetical protein